MDIKYSQTKEEMISQLNKEIKKNEKTEHAVFLVQIINIILIGCLAYFDIKPLVAISIIFFLITHLVSLFSGNWGFDNPCVRKTILEKFMDRNNNQKILNMTLIEAENPYISYKYEDNGKVLEDSLYIDKIENRLDIKEDTLFLGKEIIFAKKIH